MTQAANKVEWCLRKAQKEGTEHRGLVRIQPNLKEAQAHLRKAGHYLDATFYLKEGAFSDICASTLFYVMYQSLLAIGLKFGYESRNQECTFALMYLLIEERILNLDRALLERIASLDPEKRDTSVKIRERMQYGAELSLWDDAYTKMLSTTKEILEKAKEIIE